MSDMTRRRVFKNQNSKSYQSKKKDTKGQEKKLGRRLIRVHWPYSFIVVIDRLALMRGVAKQQFCSYHQMTVS